MGQPLSQIGRICRRPDQKNGCGKKEKGGNNKEFFHGWFI
jgi:hypothetical protein